MIGADGAVHPPEFSRMIPMKMLVTILLAAITFLPAAAQETDRDPFALESADAQEQPLELQQPSPLALEPAASKPDIKPPMPVVPGDRVKLSNSPSKSSQLESGANRQPSKMTAAQLRQARALYRSQQRIQRLEMYQWLGYEPLRPNWVSIPSMTSRYQNRTIIVPVYIHGR